MHAGRDLPEAERNSQVRLGARAEIVNLVVVFLKLSGPHPAWGWGMDRLRGWGVGRWEVVAIQRKAKLKRT